MSDRPLTPPTSPLAGLPDALMRLARQGSEPSALIALVRGGMDPMRRDAFGFRALDHALVHAGSPADAPLCWRMFEALAALMMELPGGERAIEEALARASARSPHLPVPEPLSRWSALLRARRERSELLPCPASPSGFETERAPRRL